MVQLRPRRPRERDGGTALNTIDIHISERIAEARFVLKPARNSVPPSKF
jgi:hypothetical protein